MNKEHLKEAALNYHQRPFPGKISVTPTKALTSQRDLSLAYSPGVAYACTEIEQQPSKAADYTSRANLVGVVTNGSAVLGLGNIGALASKPVMEGKGCLFKKFAGIDVFDIELNESDPAKLVDIIAAMEPTFGGINLEDIKSPECFEIEAALRERMNIPVFHDDQHGTAIVTAAAIINAIEIVGKKIESVKLVTSGAGAAAIACLDLLISMGIKTENIVATDIHGVIYQGRENLDPSTARYTQVTDARQLAEVIVGADIFLGLSAGGVLKPEMLAVMAEQPIVLAMANPDPEIKPEDAKQVRPDCLICTGRSDYPNQVNNSLCFPFIFRGALDVGATTINEAMKMAAVTALAELAREVSSDEVALAYGETTPEFGPDYLIPRSFDPRLITRIAPAVAKAAVDSGVATRPLNDEAAYQRQLERFVFQSGTTMQPVFAAAKLSPKRVAYAEGESHLILRAAQATVDEGVAFPVLIGREEVILARILQNNLRLVPGSNCEIVNVLDDARYHEIWTEYFQISGRKGVTQSLAKEEIRSRPTLIGCMLLRRGEVDALLCGLSGRFREHIDYIENVIGFQQGVKTFAAMQMIILPERRIFVCDTHVNIDPDAEQIAEMTVMAAVEVRRLGVTPSVALLSHSSFGSSDAPSARKMQSALELIRTADPDLIIDGEMQADIAFSKTRREREYPDSTLTCDANLLIMPNADAANITYSALRVAAGGDISIGSILLGPSRPVHLLTPSATARRILNMTALATVDAVSQS